MSVHTRFTAIPLLILTLLLAGCGGGPKKNQEAETHYFLGLSYLKEPNPTLALREFLTAAKIDSEDYRIQAALGQAYQLKKAYPEAEKHYLRALKLKPGDPQIQNNLASLYLDLKRWDEAIRYFRLAAGNLLFSNPENALTGIGYAHFQKNEYLEAVKAYQEALEVRNRYPQAHYLLGEAYYALDRADLAVKEFKEAISQAPNSGQAQYKLGLALVKLGELTKAKEAFVQAIKLAPDSEEGRQAAEYLKLLR